MSAISTHHATHTNLGSHFVRAKGWEAGAGNDIQFVRLLAIDQFDVRRHGQDAVAQCAGQLFGPGLQGSARSSTKPAVTSSGHSTFLFESLTIFGSGIPPNRSSVELDRIIGSEYCPTRRPWCQRREHMTRWVWRRAS